ncbi:MAG TPA: FecR domain-containing protein [Haloferula sp.]
MQAEIPDDLIDLLERLSEGDLDESGRGQLADMLREKPELRAVVKEHFLMSRALSQLERNETDFAEKTAIHVAKIANESEFGFAKKVTGKIVRQRITRAFAAAAVVALAAVPIFLLVKQPGTSQVAKDTPNEAAGKVEVATLVRMNSEQGVVSSSQAVAAGEKFTETSGLIRLDFKNGAVIAIEAPAELTVVSAMEIDLKTGKLNGWCPDTAHGFKVTTASADLTDLGTSFGVTATQDGKSQFMVLDGEVEVQKGNEKMRLTQGDAVKASTQDKLSNTQFDPSGFKNTWPLAQGIFATKGAVVPADPDVPEKVALMESDDHVLVIPERRAVPFVQPLRVDIVDTGTLPGTLPEAEFVIQPKPGKHLSSFLIRYDPVGTSRNDQFKPFAGEVTFDRPVMAIATQRKTLEGTDSTFSMGKWESVYRGIELRQANEIPDSVTLSADRRTVKVSFYAGASTDEIRVILEDRKQDW